MHVWQNHGVAAHERDWVDQHVDRWRTTFEGFDPEVEGALVRIGAVNRHVKRANTAAFEELGLGPGEYDTLHTLLIQPEPNEATPAQLAEACHVTRAAMTFAYERLPRGGKVVVRTADPDALAALHDFLRFQIREHKTGDPLSPK